MSIIELLQQTGLENIKVQFLDDCVCGNVSTSQNTKFTTISFKTDQTTPIDFVSGRGNCGIIIWVPRDKLPTKTP